MKRRVRRAAHALLALVLLGHTGCAGLTGFATGAFTGAVDAPAQVYRNHRGEFHRNPIYWPFNLLFFIPIGFVVGPLAGMGKGLALDVDVVVLGRTSYAEAFGTYEDPSIWRPFTMAW
jgi:hypothetical protein